MLLTAIVIVLLGLALLGGIATIANILDQRRREAIQALVARRGWSFTVTGRSLGRPANLRIASRGGPEWEVLSRRPSSPGQGLFPNLTTEFIAQEPRWDEGYLYIGSDAVIPPDGASPLDADAVDFVLRERILGHPAPPLEQQITRQDAPSGIAVFSTEPLGHRFDLAEIGTLWTNWSAASGRPAPVCVLGPLGLTLSSAASPFTAEDFEALIDFALALSRQLQTR